MATVDPKATLLGLIALQKLDNEIWRIRRRLAEGPGLLERRAERWKLAQARVDQAHTKILELKKQIGMLELDIKTREGEIAKIQLAQGQSRTNEEFRAFNEHANRLRKENRAVEDQILEIAQQVETAQGEQAELEKTRDSHKAEADAEAELWKKDVAEYEAELAEKVAHRSEFAKSLAPGPLSTYERVLKARDGKGIVPTEGRMCGGCQMAITPNDFTRMHRMNEIVSCRSCERILYLPELAGAAR